MSPDKRPTAPPRQVPIAAPATGVAEWEAVRAPLESGWLTQGPRVAEFERTFAVRHGVTHALATSSCTTALHLILTALDIGPGDEVIVPAFTWVATANVVVYCGATPVFADVDPHTFNIDLEDVRRKLTRRTRAILPVHLFGLCVDMEALAEVASGIVLVEDAACAAGGAIRGRPAGPLGLAGAFSFHPRKSITTGEGGMITTHDAALAKRIDQLRNHGASISEEERLRGPRPYLLAEFNLLGFNYRMTDLQAAVGCVQLAKLDRMLEERRRLAGRYARELTDLPWLRLPRVPEGTEHAWQAYVCLVDESLAPAPRNEIMARLNDHGVATRPGTHLVPGLGWYRKRFGTTPDDYPGARDCERFSMAIPLHNRMTDDDLSYVVEALHGICR